MANEMELKGTSGIQANVRDGSMGAGIVAREAQEVQAAIVVAQRSPRDQKAALIRITNNCSRQGFAETSMYQYPKGGTQVEGPSIRMAEMLAQSWGNIDIGIKELEARDGESTVEAYCWDLETNFKSKKVFTVKHAIGTKRGLKQLSDPRDIYEKVANDGARRLRACILAVIPGDVVETAVNACKNTLGSIYKGDLQPHIEKMLAHFLSLGVTAEMISARFQKNVEALNAKDLVNLRNIAVSLHDGMSKPTDWFDVATDVAGKDPEGTGRTKGMDMPKDKAPEAAKKEAPARKEPEAEAAQSSTDAQVADSAQAEGGTDAPPEPVEPTLPLEAPESPQNGQEPEPLLPPETDGDLQPEPREAATTAMESPPTDEAAEPEWTCRRCMQPFPASAFGEPRPSGKFKCPKCHGIMKPEGSES